MMGMNRRKFLKIAGLSTLLGLGGKAGYDLLAPGELEASLQGVPLTKGKKWGMVIDISKLDDKTMEKCIEACHSIHNVPNMGSPKVEIKWIWKETYDHSFPDQQHEYEAETYENQDNGLEPAGASPEPDPLFTPSGRIPVDVSKSGIGALRKSQGVRKECVKGLPPGTNPCGFTLARSPERA